MVLCKAIHCRGHVLANIMPHHLHLGGQQMRTCMKG